MNQFSKIEISGWRQFQNIEIEFDSQLTLLTGQNGSGKTTILNILSQHVGWQYQMVSSPKIKSDSISFSDIWTTDFWKKIKTKLGSRLKRPETSNADNQTHVANIFYVAESTACSVFAPTSQSALYGLNFNNLKTIDGLSIPSHRPPVSYNHIQNIPTNPHDVSHAYNTYQSILQNTYTGGHLNQRPGMIIKQSLISLALFGLGENNAVQRIPEFGEMFRRFEEVLRILLPQSLGFTALQIRMPEVVLVTKSGDFSLDAMSGGVSALFTIAWQIHMFGWNKKNCTVLIDEPENHLHPSMQREFLPSLLEAFPGFRFIVASHSPFVVSSHPDAGIYALYHNEDSRVESRKLLASDLSGSANQILREVLDVPVTSPVWVEKILRDELKALEGLTLTRENIESAYQRLKEKGISSPLD